MQARALVLALAAAATVQPARAQTPDCAQLFVYSISQVCRTLSNGFSQCEPVGLVGPAPQCVPPGVPPLVPVPLNAAMAPPPYAFVPPFPVPAAPPGVALAPPSPALPPAGLAPTSPPAPAPAVTPSPAPAVAASPAPVVTTSSAPAVTTSPAPAVTTSSAPVVTPSPAPAVAASPAPAVAASPAPAVAASPAPAVAASPAPATPPLPPSPATAVPLASPPAVGLLPAGTPAAGPAPAPAVTIAVLPTAVAPAAGGETAGMQTVVAPQAITLEDGLAHFDFDRAELSAQGRAQLDAWLRQPLPKGITLLVTGHADRLGPAAYNLKLSVRRAETVKSYLVEKGIPAADIEVVGKGESEPVKLCKGGPSKATIACLAPNRRVEIKP